MRLCKTRQPAAALLSLIVAAAASAAAAQSTELLLREDVQWEALNPLRGDRSPQAGPLWGGLKSEVSTAFLVRFIDGFSSPPHIHNVTYRGVVISGLVHNDDPEAATMWMPPGSFWTQPVGETHITSAQGDLNVAYIEIDQGPYLVRPAAEAFDTGERPVNVDASNLVWLDGADVSWVDQGGAEVAFLWGDRAAGAFNGTMVRLPAGFEGEIASAGAVFRGVVISGQVAHDDDGTRSTLNPGSYFGAKGAATHQLASAADGPSVLYVRSDGPFSISSTR